MNKLPIIKLRSSIHNEKEVVQILFERNDELQTLLRTSTHVRWSKTMNCWYLPYFKSIKQDLFHLLKNKAYLDYGELKTFCEDVKPANNKPNENTLTVKQTEFLALSEETAKKIIEFKNWMRSKRYSENTIGTYIDAITIFLRYYASKTISEITNNDIVLFNNNYILANNLSSSFQNQVVNAVKLFFRTVENKKLDPELIHRPKCQKLLPNVLSKEEVKLILNSHNNIKHKAMLSLIYSCGLRCGELLKLKPKHVDSKRGVLIIKQSKGRKDRIAPLSNKVIELLREYHIACKPEIYLFEGQQKGVPYDERSLQNVLKQALEKAKIVKPVSLHWLRHSYATHLLENGTDLRYIQEILGHSSSKTTEIYTHVSTQNIQKITSPFDFL